MQTVPKVAQFDTCMSGHCIYYTFKPEMKQILGGPKIGELVTTASFMLRKRILDLV